MGFVFETAGLFAAIFSLVALVYGAIYLLEPH